MGHLFELVDCIEAIASSKGNRVAACHGDEKLTYLQLIELSAAVAEQLSSLGVARRNVVVCLPNSLEQLVALLACWMAGAICVPVNPAQLLETDSVSALLEQVNPLVTVVSANHAELIIRSHSKSTGFVCSIGLDGRITSQGPFRMLDSCPQTTSMLHSDESTQDEPALILYSSGTSGFPKGAVHSGKALSHHVFQHARLMNYAPDDRSMVCMQMDRAFCLTSQILPSLVAGATLQICKGFDADEVRRAIESDGITLLYGYPDYFHRISSSSRPIESHTLRAGVAGAEMCTKATVRLFRSVFNVPLVQSAGMIETLAYCLNTSGDEIKTGSAGTAIGGVEVSIVDQFKQTLSAGNPGEIVVKSPSVMKGYLGEAPLAKAEFETGDIGMMDADGFLWLLGRAPLSSKYEIRQEIREQLYACPLVAESVVTHSNLSEDLVALVVPLPGRSLSDIVAHLDPRIVDWCRIIQSAVLPRLVSGKIDVRQILDSLDMSESAPVDQECFTEASIYRLQQSAAGGDPDSMFQLAEKLEHGMGLAPNVRRAARFYRLAAESGHLQAQISMAKLCLIGKGVALDAEEAAQWYLLAANQGSRIAQLNLAEMYTYGRGVEIDLEMAAFWRDKTSL